MYNNFFNTLDEKPVVDVPVGTTTSSTTPVTTTADVKNDMSGLNTILGNATTLATSAAQIGGAIKAQRVASGRSQTRQARIAACGRKPLFGRAKKDAYNKCLADAQGGGIGGGLGDPSKSLSTPPPPPPTNNTKTILIVVGSLLAVGVVGYFLMKGKNKGKN